MFLWILSIYFIYYLHVQWVLMLNEDITDTVRLQSNITSLELWIIFPVMLLLLLVWCKQKSDKKVKIIFLFLMCMTFLLLKNKNSSDFFNKVRVWTWSKLFASEFMNICDDFKFSVTQWTALFILLLNSNIGVWIHIFIYWCYFQVYKSKLWT